MESNLLSKWLKRGLFISLVFLILGCQNKIKYKSYKYENISPVNEPNIKVEGKGKIREALQINFQNLEKNFFTVLVDPKHQWLSVAKGPYLGQFYSRDTFITLMGALYVDELRNKIKYAIDWFSQYMTEDGYIPIWFGETDRLNIYWYSPYNRDIANGGIKQYDHIEEYINSIWLIYSWEGDKNWLKEKIPYARKAWKWLESRTNKGSLIKCKISKYSGADWADQVRRGGYSTFVEVFWYKATLDLAYMEKALGNYLNYLYYRYYAYNIKKEINKRLWKVSKPAGWKGESFGHYVGWIDEGGTKDYFEVDSNTFAVALGIADKRQAREIMSFINNNFDYFVNSKGATRVLYGNYNQEVISMAEDVGQNGGYWYIVSYFLSMAYHKQGDADLLYTLLDRVVYATLKESKEGLAEWYYKNGKVGGAKNYSWSLAYPFFLFYNSILGIQPSGEQLRINPCIDSRLGEIKVSFKYQKKRISILVPEHIKGQLSISNDKIKDKMLIRLYNARTGKR